MSRPRYLVDDADLDRARSDLGLSLDVRVIVKHIPSDAPGTFTQGRYCGTDPFGPFGLEHIVRVNPNQREAAANACLWHELTHAAQCERVGSFERWYSEYRQQSREVPHPYGTIEYFREYVNMPLEAEAWAATNLYGAGALHQILWPA